MTVLWIDIIASDHASATLSKVGAEAETTGKKFSGLKSAAAGLAGLAVFDLGKKSVDAFEESQQATAKLQDAFAKFPGLSDTSMQALQGLGDSLEKKTKFDHDATDSAAALLAQFGLTGQQIQQLTPLVADYAAKTGTDLTTAATTVGKALLGQGRALKDVGVNFKDTKSLAGNYGELIDGLSAKVGGFADTQGKTAAGQMAILGNRFKDIEEQVGAKLVPALEKLANVGIQVINFVSRNAQVLGPLAIGLGAVATAVWLVNTASKVWTATQAALDIVLDANPIMLIVAGLVALGVGLVEAYKHSQTFRDIVQGVFKDVSAAFSTVIDVAKAVFGFLEDHWKIIVAVVFGPMGLVIDAIVTHWQGFRDGVKAVWDFLSSYVFTPLITVIRDGIGVEVSILQTVFETTFNAIQSIISAAWNFIKPIIDTMSRALSDVAGPLEKVAGVAGKAVSGVGGVAKSVGHIFGFASGGFVPGTGDGDTVPAMLTPGEYVMPRGEIAAAMGARAGGSTPMVINVHVAGQHVAQAIIPDLQAAQRAGQVVAIDRNGRPIGGS